MARNEVTRPGASSDDARCLIDPKVRTMVNGCTIQPNILRREHGAESIAFALQSLTSSSSSFTIRLYSNWFMWRRIRSSKHVCPVSSAKMLIQTS
jgi:hypothetical protein